jgi:hypothetical protein
MVQDLSFAPSSMTVGDGYIAAGGTSSQVSALLLQLPLSIHATGGLTGAVPEFLISVVSVLQLDMRGLDGVFSFKGSVAGSVNNALHIAKEQTGAAAPLPVRNTLCVECWPHYISTAQRVVPRSTTCAVLLQARRRSSAATTIAPSRCERPLPWSRSRTALPSVASYVHACAHQPTMTVRPLAARSLPVDAPHPEYPTP